MENTTKKKETARKSLDLIDSFISGADISGADKKPKKKPKKRTREDAQPKPRPDSVWHVYSQDGSYDRIFSTLDVALAALESEMKLFTPFDPKACSICFVPDAKKITKQSLWDKFETETTKKEILSTCCVCQKERQKCEPKTGHPTIDPFLVCLSCDNHGYMIPNQGWNVGE